MSVYNQRGRWGVILAICEVFLILKLDFPEGLF